MEDAIIARVNSDPKKTALGLAMTRRAILAHVPDKTSLRPVRPENPIVDTACLPNKESMAGAKVTAAEGRTLLGTPGHPGSFGAPERKLLPLTRGNLKIPVPKRACWGFWPVVLYGLSLTRSTRYRPVSRLLRVRVAYGDP